jgi:hypothetical protein
MKTLTVTEARKNRFLFLNLEDCLEVGFLGNHDEIRQEIRTGHHG